MSDTVIYDMAQSALDYVYSQLTCTPSGLPCVKKLVVCEPHDACCDYLGVYLGTVGDSLNVSSCDEISYKSSVQFNIKLVRPCSDKSECNPSEASVVNTKNLYIDAVFLRSALVRFMSKDENCEHEFTLSPMIPICGEECSGWLVSLTVSMRLCVDPCSLPIILSERCDPCDPVPVLLQVEENNILETYE